MDAACEDAERPVRYLHVGHGGLHKRVRRRRSNGVVQPGRGRNVHVTVVDADVRKAFARHKARRNRAVVANPARRAHRARVGASPLQVTRALAGAGIADSLAVAHAKGCDWAPFVASRSKEAILALARAEVSAWSAKDALKRAARTVPHAWQTIAAQELVWRNIQLHDVLNVVRQVRDCSVSNRHNVGFGKALDAAGVVNVERRLANAGTRANERVVVVVKPASACGDHFLLPFYGQAVSHHAVRPAAAHGVVGGPPLPPAIALRCCLEELCQGRPHLRDVVGFQRIERKPPNLGIRDGPLWRVCVCKCHAYPVDNVPSSVSLPFFKLPECK